MRRAALVLLALAACSRDIPLGDQMGSSTATSGGGCTSNGDCHVGDICVDGTCIAAQEGCAPRFNCTSHGAPVCSDSTCPTCSPGQGPCCVDNGFGQCQCFCAVSCNGAGCAAAGVDPGPVAAACMGDASCACGETCQSGVCQAAASLPSCATSDDCASFGCRTDVCIGQRCVPPGWQCQNRRECGADGDCLSGRCVCVSHTNQSCASNSDCAVCAGEACVNGLCESHSTNGTGNGATTSSGGTSAATGGFTGTAGATTGTSATTGTTAGTFTSGTTGASATTSTGTVGTTASATSTSGSSGGSSASTTGATTTAGSGASGPTGGSSGTTSAGNGGPGCTCTIDADCQSPFWMGLICSGGSCQFGPSDVGSSTGRFCGSGSIGSSGSTGASTGTATSTTAASSGSGATGGSASTTGTSGST